MIPENVTNLDETRLINTIKTTWQHGNQWVASRSGWVNDMISVAKHLAELKENIPDTTKFGAALDAANVEISKDDRAALIGFGANLDHMRKVFEEIFPDRTSLQTMWKAAKTQALYEQSGLRKSPWKMENHARKGFKKENNSQPRNENREERVDETNEDDQIKEMETTQQSNVSPLRRQTRQTEPERVFKQHKVSIRKGDTLPCRMGVKFGGDEKWHSYEEIATTLDVSLEEVKKAVVAMKKNGPRLNLSCETKKIGPNEGCEIWPLTKSVSLARLTKKLKPLLDKLIDHGKKPWVKQSPTTMVALAIQIKRQIEEWEAE